MANAKGHWVLKQDLEKPNMGFETRFRNVVHQFYLGNKAMIMVNDGITKAINQ